MARCNNRDGTGMPGAVLGLILCVGVLGSAAAAQTKKEEPKMSNDDVYLTLSRVVGLDTIILAVLDVSADDAYALFKRGRDAVAANKSTLEPLARDMRALIKVRGLAFQRKDDAAFRTKFREQIVKIQQQLGDWVTATRDKLPESKREAFGNISNNIGMDPLEALLPLSEAQRDAMWAATLERDGIRSNPDHANRSADVEAANEKYEKRIAEILTAEQLATLKTYRQKAEARVSEIIPSEIRAYEERRDP